MHWGKYGIQKVSKKAMKGSSNFRRAMLMLMLIVIMVLYATSEAVSLFHDQYLATSRSNHFPFTKQKFQKWSKHLPLVQFPNSTAGKSPIPKEKPPPHVHVPPPARSTGIDYTARDIYRT